MVDISLMDLLKKMIIIKTDLTEEQEKELFPFAREFEIPTNKYNHPAFLKISFRGSSNYKNADVWAILDPHGNCYNNQSRDWEWEPSPSNRNKRFLKHCRFRLDKALKIVNKIK
jgi:hypothetical protein